MHKFFFYRLLVTVLCCWGIIQLSGCSKSDDQREFENEALAEPRGITEVDTQGNVIDADPDDWRISPMYRGLITMGTPDNQPPFPNPLSFNQRLEINIYIRSLETLNRFEVYSFKQPTEANSPAIAIRENISTTTLVTLNLSGQIISGSSGGSQASGLYRIVIYDGQQNVITYGDIQIGSSDVDEGS